MPLKLKLQDHKNTSLMVWEMEEENEFFSTALSLTVQQLDALSSYSPKRKREWLSTRYILKLLLGTESSPTIIKDEYGKPFIKDVNKFLSISHSHDLAAAIISDTVVGIDIQKLHGNISRIAHKFISEEELSYMQGEALIQHMHINWGAKESMYKAYGKKALRFAEHMKVAKFELKDDTSQFNGFVSKDEVYMQFDLGSRLIDNYILVHAIQS